MVAVRADEGEALIEVVVPDPWPTALAGLDDARGGVAVGGEGEAVGRAALADLLAVAVDDGDLGVQLGAGGEGDGGAAAAALGGDGGAWDDRGALVADDDGVAVEQLVAVALELGAQVGGIAALGVGFFVLEDQREAVDEGVAGGVDDEEAGLALTLHGAGAGVVGLEGVAQAVGGEAPEAQLVALLGRVAGAAVGLGRRRGRGVGLGGFGFRRLVGLAPLGLVQRLQLGGAAGGEEDEDGGDAEHRARR